MLPIYCIRILINIFVEFASSVQFNAEPQFSPLTPYQTADSLPPPVYGLLEGRSELDLKLRAAKSLPKSTWNWRNYYDIKRKKKDEIPRLSSKKRLSFASSENAQSKNWKIPPGAKLIGYNVQMIAGYIPTIYLEKGDKERLESGNSTITPDTYSKYLPGYNMTMKRSIGKNYNVNQQNDEMDTVTTQIDWLENITHNVLLKDEPIIQTNFSQRENRYLEKREDSVDSISTTVGIIDSDGFLWPVTDAESEVEKSKEQNIATNEMGHSITGNNDVNISISPIKHNFLIFKKNTRITTTIEPDSRDIKNRLEAEIVNDSIPVLQSIIAINSAESIPRIASTYDINGSIPLFISMGRKTVEKSQLVTSEDTNFSMNSRYNDAMVEHSTSIPEVQVIQQTTPISETLSEIEMSQTPSKISKLSVIVPENTVNSALVQQNNIDKNRSTDDIILMIKPYEREEGVEDMKGALDIQAVSLASLQNSTLVTMSDAIVMTQTTIMNIDSSEFEDKNYDRAKHNEKDADNFDPFSITPVKSKLENPMKFLKTQPINRQRHKMNTTLDFDQDSRNINDYDEYEKSFQGAESFENDRNDNDELSKENLIDEKNMAKNQNNQDVDSKSKEDFRNDYNEKDNDDIVYDDNDDNDDNSEDNSKLIEKIDEEMSQSKENSEEEQGQVNGPIFSPEQIPSFEEWLSSLPIQPFPFPNIKSSKQNHQPPTDHFHLPFLRLFKGNRREGIMDEKSNEQEEHLDVQMHDHDNSKENEKNHFQEYRFSLPRNVPYK